VENARARARTLRRGGTAKTNCGRNYARGYAGQTYLRWAEFLISWKEAASFFLVDPAMDERGQAIRVLRRTRDILVQRLSERILEAEEEILAEAEGHSFLSEIETIYDQIGLRLVHVNQMLAHLPAAEPGTAEEVQPASPDLVRPGSAEAPSPPQAGAAAECSISSFLALPPPSGSRTTTGELATSALLMFAVHARRGDLETGALSLESLFGLSRDRALSASRVFHAHCVRDASYVENAARLQNYLEAEALSRAFGLMCESFGLSGGESLSALMWWRTRTAR
jgi:hypothetical protein